MTLPIPLSIKKKVFINVLANGLKECQCIPQKVLFFFWKFSYKNREVISLVVRSFSDDMLKWKIEVRYSSVRDKVTT